MADVDTGMKKPNMKLLLPTSNFKIANDISDVFSTRRNTGIDLLTIDRRAQPGIAEQHQETPVEDLQDSDATGRRCAAPADPAVLIYAQSRLTWLAARKALESEIGRLRNEVIQTCGTDGGTPELTATYDRWLLSILENLDESLADKLDDAINAKDPAERAQHVADARTIMDRYKTFVSNSELIDDLDDNPFLKLTVRATINSTIAVLSKMIR